MLEDTSLLPKKSHQPRINHQAKVKMALEVNIMRQQSETLMSKSQQKKRALAEQTSIDRYMDRNGQVEEVQKIHQKYAKQIEEAKDPN